MKAAVLGSPISHSLSPALHRAAYAALGLTDWTYEAIECDEAGLPGLLAGCGPDWAGLSLTMPLKRAVLPLLDEADPLVGEVGAANTVVLAGGRRVGHNTDVPGMVDALAEMDWTGLTGPGEVLVLGGGATACSALAALAALGCGQARVAVRDRTAVSDLRAAAGRLGVQVELCELDLARTTAPELLISTLPAGAADPVAERLDRGDLAAGWVLDVVYHPWPTPLVVAAEKSGATVAGGFGLLLHQAAGQVTLLTGQAAPLAQMRAAGLAALGR